MRHFKKSISVMLLVLFMLFSLPVSSLASNLSETDLPEAEENAIILDVPEIPSEGNITFAYELSPDAQTKTRLSSYIFLQFNVCKMGLNPSPFRRHL